MRYGKYALFLCPLMMMGCATYNESFDCEPGKGVGCVSLSHVNHPVDKGELPLPSDGAIPEKASPAPQTLRIWIAPHQDSDGIFHEASLLNLPLGESA